MTDDFDDDALRNAIGSRSGGPVHTSTARRAVIARAERTRTVRTGAIVGTTGLVVIAGLFLLPNIGDTQPEPADQPAAPTIAPAPTTTNPATGTPTSNPGTTRPTTTAADTRPDASSPAVPATTAPSTPSTTPAPRPHPAPTTQPASAPATTTAPSGTPTTTLAPPTTTTAPDPSDPPFTQEYDSTGGSITVNWNGTALTLVSTVPAPGYATEIEDQSADRIRVRFRSDSNDSRIEVRVRDGHVEHTIS